MLTLAGAFFDRPILWISFRYQFPVVSRLEPGTGDWKRTGNWKLGTGNWRLSLQFLRSILDFLRQFSCVFKVRLLQRLLSLGEGEARVVIDHLTLLGQHLAVHAIDRLFREIGRAHV